MQRISSTVRLKITHFFAAICLISIISLNSLYASELDAIRLIADKGAVQLALTSIDRQQNKLLDAPDEWIRWEKFRFELYAKNNDWPSIIHRAEKLPEFVTPDFRTWVNGQHAAAFVAMGEGSRARIILRDMLWADAIPDLAELQNWRRLIIESYLNDDNVNDASTAILRYRIDYGDQNFDDVLLRVRIDLLNQRYKEAISLLLPYKNDARSETLIMYAQMQAEILTFSDIYRDAQKNIKEINKKKGKLKNKEKESVYVIQKRANLWLISAEAARRSNMNSSAAYAYEFVLINQKNITLPQGIINYDENNLWQSYLDYALTLANKQQLLIGQDKKWIEFAVSVKEKHPVGARALCAFIMLRSQDESLRNEAGNLFLELIKARDDGSYLLQILFVESDYFDDLKQIPVSIRHELVDIALRQSNIDFASELMATIDEPPKDSDQFMWRLRRARILVLGNQSVLGVTALNEILNITKTLSAGQIDRYIQVLFDLQETGQHALVLPLFERVFVSIDDTKIQRELYFWMADSHKALKQYSQAAELYLKSAMYPEPNNMDPWAQTAIYQSANALAKAGLYDDARMLYQGLLYVTEEPNRRRVLQREIQGLWRQK